jgi:putative transcriptional regulator
MSSDPTNLTGKFLIALPAMGDPRFHQSVIYLCSHDESGAMGLIINKSKGPLNLSDMLTQIGVEGDVAVADTPVLNGGPVDIDRGFVLHSADYFRKEVSLKLSETMSLTSTRDILEALVTDKAPERAILAVGYSGWGPGQIEREIVENAWITADADETLIFDTDMDAKWTRAIAQLGITPEMLAHSGGRA